MTETTRQASGLAGVLAEHDARWTTHGWDRPYEVIHCVGADCDWSLRQKALMTDEDCYEAHRAHVAAAVLAWVDARLGEAREGVAVAIHHDGWEIIQPGYELRPESCGTCRESLHNADAALTAVREALGVPQDAQNGAVIADRGAGGVDGRSEGCEGRSGGMG